MDVHKPKPWHGLREFFKEYLIIVVGVLTALAAEQAVEAMHTRHELGEIASGLDRTISLNLVSAVERLSVQPCLDARIVELRNRLSDSGEAWSAAPEVYPGRSGDKLPLVPEAFHSPSRIFNMAAWQAALASRDVNAMPLERRGRYSVTFGNFQLLNEAQAREHAISSDLDALSFDLRLTPELRAHFLARLGALAREDATIAGTARFVLDAGKANGWRPDPAGRAKTIATQREFRGDCVQDRGL